MPAKMASFSLRHSAGVRASMSASSGPPMLSVVGMPPAGSNASMKPWTRSRISLSGGRKDHALVSMRISERTRSGRARTSAHDDPAAHGVAQQVDRPLAHRLEQGRQVGRELLDGVAVEVPRLGRVPVPPLVEGDHAPVGRQRVDLQREVVGGPGVAVTEHERRRPRGTAPPLGPGQVDAVHVEDLGRSRRRCHAPLSSCSSPSARWAGGLSRPSRRAAHPESAESVCTAAAGAGELSVRDRGHRGAGRHRDVGAGAGLVPRRQRGGGGVARERLGQVVDDDGRSPGHLVDVPAGGRDHQRPAGVLGRRVVVEGEVAQAVVDVGRAEVAAAEQDVGMRADDDVGARLHQHLGQRLLQGVGAGIELGAPVEVDDDRVGRLARRLHRRHEVVHVVGGGQARAGSRWPSTPSAGRSR